MAEALTPRDHLFATKRPPIDTHYFETFNRPNVRLVDLKTTPIAAIVPEGVRTSDATYPLDVIVFATGFDALTGPLLALDIRAATASRSRTCGRKDPVAISACRCRASRTCSR